MSYETWGYTSLGNRSASVPVTLVFGLWEGYSVSLQN